MSSGDRFDPMIDGGFSDDTDLVEDKIEKEINKEGMMKKLLKRPDFPLFLLGLFILVLLLFILVKLPGGTIEKKNEAGYDAKVTKDLKKELSDIKKEIVEIKFMLSGDETDQGSEFVTALNSLEKRFDKRLGSIEAKLSNINSKSLSPKTTKKSSTKASSKKIKKPAAKKSSKKIAKKDNSFYYLVQKGDTLYGIAKKNRVSVPDLRLWNKIKNNSIAVGQRLLIKK